MISTTAKSFYAFLASVVGLGTLSWLYVTFTKQKGEGEHEELPCLGNGEDHTDDHKFHNDNDVDENADFGAEKALKICENKINEKEKCLSTVFATDEASCNRSDEKLLNQQNPSNNHFETNLFTLETKKAYKNVGSETEKIVNDESYPTNTKIFENPSESSEISCSTEAHTYSMPYCLPQQNREESSNESNYVEEISQVVPPFELDENDSLEESDETETFLEGTKQTKNHFETKTDSNNGKNLSEENIDCGLGDSLMEDGAEVLSTIDKPLQKYFIHEQQPFNNLAQKTEKGNAEVAHSKKLNRADTRIAAIFSKTSKATDNQNIENNSIKNKSKIPHITVKPLSKPDSNFKTQEKKDISAPKVSPVVKTNKVKGYKTGLKKPTNIKQSSVKVESQNQKKVNNSTRHSKHDFKINLSHHNSNNETLKKPVNQGVIRPLQNHNHKTSEHLMEDKETAHSQVSNENEFIYNNMDDSLEDFTTLAVDMTDSLEEVSGILDEPSYLDGLVDDDFEEKEHDVKNIDSVDEKKRIDFPEDLREVSSFVLNRKEDFKNDEERELRVFEDAEKLTTSLETGFHDDSKDIDQSHFIEQSENELLLNLASHNNDVDSFILLLGRNSISKQQRQHCWMCLERISCNFSRSSSFNAHLRFIFSSIEKLSMHLSYTRSPLKVAFNLSKNSESILFILSTKATSSLLRLFLYESPEDVLLNWLPLVANLFQHIRLHNITSHVIWEFCCQHQLHQEQPSMHSVNPNNYSDASLDLQYQSHSKCFHVESSEEKLINVTLYHVLFGHHSKQVLADRIHVLTNHTNTHITHLARCLYTFLVHS